MTHLFKWPNKFADVFFISVDEDSVEYEVRDKISGKLVEPKRKTKYIVNEAAKMVHFDARECPLELFGLVFKTLQ